MIELTNIEPKDIRASWPDVYPWLKTAIDQNPENLDGKDALRLAKKGLMGVYTAHEDGCFIAAWLCCMITYPKQKAFRIVLGGGPPPVEDWYSAEVIHAFDREARRMGAQVIELFGRPAWVKLFRGIMDYKYAVLVREV